MTNIPEYHFNEDFQTRSVKLRELRELGIDPYPHSFTPTHTSQELKNTHNEQKSWSSADAAAGDTESVCLGGRLILFRAMGKNAFGHIQDHTGKIQIMINRDVTKVAGYNPETCSVTNPPSHVKLIEKKLDLGDIIGIKGYVFWTMKGELTIYAHEVTVLCKTLLPLPDKHSGLTSKEIRYRKRWLDLITSHDVVNSFRLRSHILKTIRQYFEKHCFIEIETPVLQSVYGGAQARPFITNFNVLDQEMYLRISLEIPHKKLIVGGMHRIFEISKVFRNEGIDKNHNPEFTELEAYAAYWDYNDMMSFTEKLFETIAIEIFGDTKVPLTSNTDEEIFIDMKAPWQRLTMKGSIKKFTGHDIDTMSDDDIKKVLLDNDESLEPKDLVAMPRGLLISTLFEETVEHNLIQPHHIIDHPIETTPLCKPHRNPKDREDGIVERFESFIMGREICNAYTELNDPEMQRELLVKQSEKRDAGDEEANPLDEEFIEAICQGMPPTSGVGIGIDRLVMLFTNAISIRDVLYFPFMKQQS